LGGEMMQYSKKDFLNFILAHDVVGFFDEPIRLSCGRYSSWYVNWRTVAEDVFLLDQLTDYVLAYTKEQDIIPDTYFGVSEGATKLGLVTQYKHALQTEDYMEGTHRLAMGRGKQKEHGAAKDRYFLGTPKDKTLVLEDVITTGDSLLKSITQLEQAGVRVMGALALTDRLEKGIYDSDNPESLATKDVLFHALIDAYTLLPAVFDAKRPPQYVRDNLNAEIEQYGRIVFRV
jgi:orotate phosphoribosyltransferase